MNKVIVADPSVDFRRGVDYIGVTVCFIVHDGKGNILLQKRSRNCRDEQGKWDIGGGAVEFGETLIEAVQRELSEEYRTVPLTTVFLKAYEALRNNNGTPTHWMAFVHAVEVNPTDISIGEPEKVDEIGWFTSSNLPEPLHSQFYHSFNAALEQGIIA